MMHQLIDKKNKIIIYFIFLIILSSVTNKSLENQDSFLIKIKKINVSGLSNNNNLKIKKELSELLYKNIFLINKENIKKKIVQYNLVEEYNIKKIYPNQIDIKIKQTKFIAKIKKNNYFLIGSNGKLISNEYTNETLPFFFGKFNSERFLRFKEIVNNSEFKFKNFKSIFFYSSNRWDVQTNDDVLIKLPEKNLLKALKVAHKIINNNKFEDRRVIDLRISNHIIMQ
jgi:cell division protein FtsQ